MRKFIASAALASVLILGGCAAQPEPELDPYTVALGACIQAYNQAPKWTSTLGGPTGACANWEESQGRDAFVSYWSDPSRWKPYMEKIYQLEN